MRYIDVSIIIPAYNEEKRIKPFIRDLVGSSKQFGKYELIFVDDGSKDHTLDVIKEETKRNKKARIIHLKENRGKGFAIKSGVEIANGRKIIFIDADGSISPGEIPKFINALDFYDVAVGDRTSNESEVVQPFLRKITGTAFNFYVALLFNTRFKDNLCGIKGFRKEIAGKLFRELKSERWIFDVEIFYRIKKSRFSLLKLPIRWVHKTGSKIRLTDPAKMLFQLIRLRILLTQK